MNSLVIAKYLRISAEDMDIKKFGKNESDSIGNQRNLIEEFINQKPEFAGADILEFCDDGWSGKNFERPAVAKMLEQVTCGRINCIIVKDLSRFGRDYLTVGNYITRVFPFLGVRFIAINDGLDSVDAIKADSLETSFKTLLYDFYSRDLSHKVRSAKQFKAKRGDFLSPFAPYGYVKAADNKNQLVIDSEAAKIVHRIFQMAADGKRPVQIAKILNAEQVLTPMLYKRAAGCSRSEWPCVDRNNFWTDDTVTKILRDERYTGRTIYGKRTRDEVGKNHVVSVQRSDWIVVENTHQGIVSKEEYEHAQEQLREYMERNAAIDGRKGTMLYKKVRCGVCGHVMKRVNAKQPYYVCNTPRLTDTCSCMEEPILEKDLTETVLTELRMQVLYAVEISHIWEEKRQNERTDANVTAKMISNLQEVCTKLESSLQGLYEKFALGELDKDGYLKAKCDTVKKRDAVLQQMQKLEAKQKKIQAHKTLENQYTETEELAVEMAADVMGGLVVYPDYELNIIWNYQEDLRQLIPDMEASENKDLLASEDQVIREQLLGTKCLLKI
ncbi:MAG: recombinase family protein [Lachnospiraceae bacterium]|nr:recombinase family protein [Lachnospiraceae bacterium]